MSDGEIPDPLVFVARCLHLRDALVEREGDALVVMLPEVLSRALAVPEEFRASTHTDTADVVPLGIGSPLLERLAADARTGVAWSAIGLDLDAPKASHAQGLAGRLVVRNGLVEALDAAAVETTYSRASVAWVVEADDRYEGVVHVVSGPDGSEPEPSLAHRLDVTAGDAAPRAAPCPADHVEHLDILARRATQAVAAAVTEPIASVTRRHARDHGRMWDYFAGLTSELGRGRRKVDPTVLTSKAAAITAERDARLRDLVVRYTPKVTAEVVAVVFARVPTVRVNVKLRRRKGEREVRVTLASGAQSLDALACEGCGGATRKPALCDDRLHVLCERCVPQAQGRFDCPACTRPKPRA